MIAKNDSISRQYVLDQFRFLRHFRDKDSIYDDMVSVVKDAPSEGVKRCCDTCDHYKPDTPPHKTAIVGGCQFARVADSTKACCSEWIQK